MKTFFKIVIATIAFSLLLIVSGIVKFDFSNQYENTTNIPKARYSESIKNALNISIEKDQILIINFWETWCKPCREEMPILNKLKADFYTNPNILFYAVSKDDSMKVAQFKIRYNSGLNFEHFYNVNGLRSSMRKNHLMNSNTITDIVPVTFIINGKDSALYYKEGMLSSNDYNLIREILNALTQK